jgi:hypothetical protein
VQDASFDNLKASGSQGGRYLLAADKGILTAKDDALFPICVLEWGSTRIKRVVRSTLAAECYSMGEGVDSLEYLRFALSEMYDPEWAPRRREELAAKIQAAVVTDAKSLHDHLKKEGSSSKDRRIRLEINIIRSTAALQVRWVRSEMMIADHLTKEVPLEIMEYARTVCSTCRWTLGIDPRAPAPRKGRPLEVPGRAREGGGEGAAAEDDEESGPPPPPMDFDHEGPDDIVALVESRRRRVHRGRRPRQVRQQQQQKTTATGGSPPPFGASGADPLGEGATLTSTRRAAGVQDSGDAKAPGSSNL